MSLATWYSVLAHELTLIGSSLSQSVLLPRWNMQNIYILLIEIIISKENLPREPA